MNQNGIFKHWLAVRVALSLLVVAGGLCLTSCATNEELEARLGNRNENYQHWQDRRQIREQARDERYDAWFDRVMN